MRHRFTVEYEIDCPVAIAVAVYLDAEHYVFLHKKYSDTYEVLSYEPATRKILIRESWELFGLRIGQICMTEYVPPAEFLNYDIEPYPRWLPSAHHVMKARTRLRLHRDPRAQFDVEHARDRARPALLDLAVPPMDREGDDAPEESRRTSRTST